MVKIKKVNGGVNENYKKGNLQKKEKRLQQKFKCKLCGCKFVADYSEYEKLDNCWKRVLTYSADCPCCKEKVTLRFEY